MNTFFIINLGMIFQNIRRSAMFKNLLKYNTVKFYGFKDTLVNLTNEILKNNSENRIRFRHLSIIVHNNITY
jgi:hypothetical protein